MILPNVGVCNSSDELSVLDSATAQDLMHPPKGILASLVSFFRDRASSLVTVPLPKQDIVPQRERHSKPKWLPAQRMITVNKRLALFLAVVWCTTAEILLFQKYPEVIGHDTKASVSEVPAPWWYSIGIRENKHTFVVMFEILNVLETTSYKEFDETHAPVVESGLLDIRSKLPVFPQRVLTTVARRPAGQQQRRGAGGGGTAKRVRGGAAATRPSVARDDDVIIVSDDVPEANFHFNPMTRRMEYRSSGASGGSSGGSSSDDSAPHLPPFRRTNLGGAWLIDSQRDSSAI